MLYSRFFTSLFFAIAPLGLPILYIMCIFAVDVMSEVNQMECRDAPWCVRL